MWISTGSIDGVAQFAIARVWKNCIICKYLLCHRKTAIVDILSYWWAVKMHHCTRTKSAGTRHIIAQTNNFNMWIMMLNVKFSSIVFRASLLWCSFHEMFFLIAQLQLMSLNKFELEWFLMDSLTLSITHNPSRAFIIDELCRNCLSC